MNKCCVTCWKWLPLFTFAIGCFQANAQLIDSMMHNGEQYYVYPFRKEVSIHRDYWKIVDDDAFFEDYNNYFNHFTGDFVFSREKFQKARTQKRKDDLQEKLEDHWKQIRSGRKFGKAATYAIRQAPGELIEVSYNHEKDVLPPFGNIPDGKYVQLFEDFCLVDENGKCQFDQKRIAGYFTIKENAIDGEVIWMNFKGDTLKQGSFVNGLKEGEWSLKFPEELWYSISRNDRKSLRKEGSIRQYFAEETATFKNGLNHGSYTYKSVGGDQKVSGSFEFGEPTGEWKYMTNDFVTLRVQMADRSDTVISKKPILRGVTMETPREFYRKAGKKLVPYDISCQEAPMPAFPSNFYEVQFNTTRTDENLELEGENEKSFDLTDAGVYDGLGGYNNRYGYPHFDMTKHQNKREIDPMSGISYPRWYVMDSLGARMKYDGVYEQYYMNGQLFFRYEFKNGELLKEDTLFWENGSPLDVITFQPDSNKYFRSLYARDGILYEVMIYDSLGKFIEYDNDEPTESVELIIDGLLAKKTRYGRDRYEFGEYQPTFYYSDRDTLSADSLPGKVVLSRTWASDTTIQTSREYDPLTREYTSQEYNCFGEVHAKRTKTFTENFSGWRGTSTAKYGDLTLKGNWSGVREDWEGVDTLGHQSVSRANSLYNLTSDVSLYQNDELFTGEFKYKWKMGLSEVKGNSKTVKVKLSRGYFGYGKFYRAQRRKKERKQFMLASITNDIGLGGVTEQVQEDFNDLFMKLLFDQNGYLGYNSSISLAVLKCVDGQFLDGKAHGIWTAYDYKGNVLSTVNFNKGEADGELRMYNYQNKRPKRWNYYAYEDYTLDTFPKRRTRYLQHVVNYKNGLREGTSVEYDWLGRISKKGNYANDLMTGKMISRDSEAHTEATFKYGLLDGYLRTFLTFPDRDSILLYDINLQSGSLNGESRSYHTNGKLGKRGFFLDGEPIEDYEAYDTLGFKYHYVKFEYGMPVEEKIWEENALSIRYQFDWKDSIPFYPEDITSTQSLDALLAQEGYINYTTEDKYYGRPTLISKKDIECQMTKYYPNDTVARNGRLQNKQKIGLWKFYGYNGNFLYEADYFDSVIVINDSVKFKSKGILTEFDDNGNRLYSAYIIEKFEKYDCAHTDHYEIRQLLTIDEVNDTIGRMNGYVFNYYDNGTLQSEGTMKNGIPDGLWKFYDPFGKLNKMGNYTLGKRNGRWLEGDLAKKKYLGEICMNPNLPDLEKQQKYQENLLDITILNYMMGRLMSTQYYDVNMNRVLEIEESKKKN